MKMLQATNGQDALQLLKRKKVDAIFVDYIMPDMNGVEFIQEVAKIDETLPVILGSGSSSAEIKERYPNQPIEMVFEKPYDYQALIKYLREKVQIGMKSRKQVVAPVMELQDIRGLNILLVDDSEKIETL